MEASASGPPLPGSSSERAAEDASTSESRAGRARVATRMRLATSQRVAALARLSDGSVWMDAVDVGVALAACLEGEGS